MRISKLWMDRFLGGPNLELVGLTSGVNVILGGTLEAADSLRRFVSACLHGGEEDEASPRLPEWNGRLTLVDGSGEHVIRCGHGDVPVARPHELVKNPRPPRDPRSLRDWQGPREVAIADRKLFFGGDWTNDFGQFVEDAFSARAHDAAWRAELDTTIQQLRREIAALEHTIHQRDEQLHRLALEAEATARRIAPANEAELTWRNETLREIDGRLQRWRDALLEIEVRLRHLPAEAASIETSAATSPHSALPIWSRLDQQLAALRESLERTRTEDGCPYCQQRRAWETLPHSLATLHDEVKQLGAELHRCDAAPRPKFSWSRDQILERDQLIRCDAELRRAIDDELRRRTRLLAEIAELQAAPGVIATPTRLEFDSPLADEQQQARRVQLGELRAELAELESAVGGSALCNAASHWLELVTHGRWRRVDFDRAGVLQLTDSSHRTESPKQMNTSERRQLRAALWLTLADEFASREQRWPIILCDSWFRAWDLDQDTVARAAQSFHDRELQLLAFTSRPDVAQAFRRRGATVFELSSPMYRDTAAPIAPPASAPPAPAPLAPRSERPQFEPWSVERSRRERRYIRSRDWNSEEFPGELTDRVRSTDDDSDNSLPGSRSNTTNFLASERTPRERVPFEPERAEREPTDHERARYDRELADREFDDADRHDRMPREAREPREPSSREARDTRERTSRRSRSRRYYLTSSDPIVNAPSIGPRMAERFEAIGIRSVADFLLCSPVTTAEKLEYRRITADTIRQWQAQATLVLRVLDLRGHDAQMLVACDITTPEQLAASDAETLWRKVGTFADSIEGKRILRNGTPPDREEVQAWIAAASEAASSHAA